MAGLLGLVIVSIQIAAFVGFEAYGIVTRDVSYRMSSFFAWGRFDFYLCVFALVTISLGKGRFRVPLLLSSLMLEAVWFLIGFGA